MERFISDKQEAIPYQKVSKTAEENTEKYYYRQLPEEHEYSRAVTPQIRQAGNRLSGLAETAYASLLA